VTDSHAHLDACKEPAGALVTRARAAGVTRIVTIGTGVDSCRSALAIADANEGVYAALGVDPHRAASPEAARLDELRELLAHAKAVAVGETGLDNVRRFASPAEQRSLFDAHLGVATDLDLPIVIHSRAADGGTAAALEGFAGTVVLHCFSSPGLLPTALERGYYVSFAGNATYPKAHELRDAAAAVPADRLLVETDSPYLSPQPVRGRPNEPAHVVHTIAALADVRGVEPAALAALTHENAAAAFGLP
jgi:TatD DNase family protein